jgi:pyruvate dehydrogenase E2 component (dihydrolipoamide acetyltransferase)
MEKFEIRVPNSAAADAITQHIFWIKKTGDEVTKGGAVASVERSKGLMFITSPADGILCEQSIMQGEMVSAGDIIGYIEVG